MITDSARERDEYEASQFRQYMTHCFSLGVTITFPEVGRARFAWEENKLRYTVDAPADRFFVVLHNVIQVHSNRKGGR